MKIFITSSGRRDLDSLDESIKNKIYNELDNLSSGKTNVNVKKIKSSSLKRLRVGDYRILYEQIKDKIYIVNVKHRREVYRDI